MTVLQLIPRATEKSYDQSLRSNTYVFDVPTRANRQQIKAAIQDQFSVDVVAIRTLIQNGKTKRFSRSSRSQGVTTRKDNKKAYVTLKEGQKINVFDDLEKEAKGAE